MIWGLANLKLNYSSFDLGASSIRQVNLYGFCYCNLLTGSTNVNEEMKLTFIGNQFKTILLDVLFVYDKLNVKNSWTFVFACQLLEYLMRHDLLTEYDACKTSAGEVWFNNRWRFTWWHIHAGLVWQRYAKKLLLDHINLYFLHQSDWFIRIIVSCLDRHSASVTSDVLRYPDNDLKFGLGPKGRRYDPIHRIATLDAWFSYFHCFRGLDIGKLADIELIRLSSVDFEFFLEVLNVWRLIRYIHCGRNHFEPAEFKVMFERILVH